MIMPAGMTVLTRAAGPQRVGRVLSVVGVPMLLGPVLGPVLGGFLVDDVSWRWIFFVNLPIGAIALPLAWRILDRDVPQPAQRLDVLGLLPLSPGLALLVYGLAETSSSGGVTSAGALGGLLGGAALIALFIRHALRRDQPLIDLSLFRVRAFSAAIGTTFLLAAAMFGSMLLVPLYFQAVRGQSALHAGLLLAPQGLGAALAMPIAGRFTDRNGAGKVVLSGLILVALGMLILTQVSSTTSYVVLDVALVLTGLGMGSTMMPAMSAAYQTLAPAAVARATSALNVIQRVGGSIGTAILAVVLQQQITHNIPQAHGGGLGAAQSVPAGARAHLAPLLATSFSHTFWWAVGLVAIAVIPAVLLPRRRPPAVDAAAPAPAMAEGAMPGAGTDLAPASEPVGVR
jgi:EmrB/QacA subfamily drug resistance transporter